MSDNVINIIEKIDNRTQTKIKELQLTKKDVRNKQKVVKLKEHKIPPRVIMQDPRNVLKALRALKDFLIIKDNNIFFPQNSVLLQIAHNLNLSDKKYVRNIFRNITNSNKTLSLWLTSLENKTKYNKTLYSLERYNLLLEKIDEYINIVNNNFDLIDNKLPADFCFCSIEIPIKSENINIKDIEIKDVEITSVPIKKEVKNSIEIYDLTNFN